MMTQPQAAPRSRRLILWASAALIMAPVLAALALPYALSTSPGRDWLLGRASKTLRPGWLGMGSIRLSWFRPTRITDFEIISKDGDQVVSAAVVTWDRNLFQILFQRPKLGTIRLDRAAINLKRAPDGTIDLEETLRPVVRDDPKTALRVEVRDGRFRIRGEGLTEPLSAEPATISVDVVPSPGPISWRADLVNGDAGKPANALTIEGRLEHSGVPADLTLAVIGRDWPLALGGRGVGCSARLDGRISASRKAGRWALVGDAALLGLAANGTPKDFRPRIDRLSGVWDVAQSADGWDVRRFDLIWASTAISAKGTVGTRDGGVQVVAGIEVTGHSPETGPITVRVRASAPKGFGRIDLAELGVKSRFVGIAATGRIDDPRGRRIADVSGTLAPHWEAVNAWLAENVEPAARVSGGDRPFKINGALSENWRETLKGEIGAEVQSADVYGMKLGPVAVVLRTAGGKLTVDPIETTVNGGRLHLEPEVRSNDQTGLSVLLGSGSTLSDAAVNDEVSRRVLSFVAPVLDNATRVRGRVSARVEKAEFPIAGGPTGRGPTVEGSVVFQELEFVPGPLLDGLFALTGREDRSGLKLNDPVHLTIADRRVSQRGLTIPIGNLSKIEVEGSVGFDRTLDLTASVPILPTTLAERPILGALAADAHVRVPIRGTLRAPEIDREAFRLGLKELGATLLGRGALPAAAGLLERLARPRDPDAPAPLTPQERRERRQEKRAERQIGRGMTPD